MKIFLSVAVTMALGVVSTTCMADGGNFFVSGDLGQSNYHVDSASVSPSNPMGNALDQSQTAGAFRFGYRWYSVVDFGLEAGHVDLGQVGASVNRTFGPPQGEFIGSYRETLRDDGWLLGGNLKYDLGSHWYLSARGGWFRSRVQDSGTSLVSFFCKPGVGYLCPAIAFSSYDSYSVSQNVNGEYVGLGTGFDFSSHVSLGLSYDYYHSPRLTSGQQINVGLFSVSAEIRF